MGQSHKVKTVDHSKGFRQGQAHTNTIEGFWALVKRGIHGVYYQVGAEYLQSYIDEYSYRYNRRFVMRPMFHMMMDETPRLVCMSARERRLSNCV
jgi:hypothetical protein